MDLHRELRTACCKHIVGLKLADCKSSTAFWALQVLWAFQALHTSIKDPRSERIFFMEKNCASYQLRKIVKITTDGRTKIAETQKFNLIDATNRVCVKKSMSMADKLDRG